MAYGQAGLYHSVPYQDESLLYMDQKAKLALVALGANLPLDGRPPVDSLMLAAQQLGIEGFEIHAKSKMYQTPCFPQGAGPDYVNAAVALKLPESCDVASLLASLHQIEAQFGRERKQRWGMRTLDLDLLAVDDWIRPDEQTVQRWMALPPETQRTTTPEQLILPHPRLQDRAFVLVPLSEIAPNWRHPLLGQTVLEMLESLPEAERLAIKPLE